MDLLFHPGMRGHDIKSNDIETLSERAAQLGIDCIQLALRKSMQDIAWENGMFSIGLADRIKKALEKYHVTVPVLGCYINPISKDEAALTEQTQMFREMLLFAKYIGAGMVGTETGMWETFAQTDSQEAYEKLLRTMTLLCGEAEKLGVLIGIELVSCHVLNTPGKAKRFLDDIKSPNLCVIFDPVNMLKQHDIASQHQLIDESFTLFGEKIAAVHLKDFTIDGETVKRASTGFGMFDFAYLFSVLKKKKPYIDMIFDELYEEELEDSTNVLSRIWQEI